MKNLLALSCLSAALLADGCMKEENDKNVNAQDKAFVREITLSNRSEISLAQLALTKTTDASVRTYAQLMVTDHTMAETQLNDLVNGESIDRPTDSLNGLATSIKPVLMGLNGRLFDSAYMASQVLAHQTTRKIIEDQMNGGNNGSVLDFAQMVLPKIQTHLAMADTIAARFR